jgi:hypothetical protein
MARHFPVTRFGYSVLAGVQGLALLLFVVASSQENQVRSAAERLLWAAAGGFGFVAWAIVWLATVVLAAGHYLHARRHEPYESQLRILRLLNGFVFFPPFLAVTAYLPAYFLVGLAAGLLP